MPKPRQRMIALKEPTYKRLLEVKKELQGLKKYSMYTFDHCITDLINFYKTNQSDGSFAPTMDEILQGG